MTDRPTAPYPVVHEPSRKWIESTNVWEFMQTYDIGDHEELIARTTGDGGNEGPAGLEWFWDELVEYLDIEFFTPYDQVCDDTDGPQFTDWYPGGRLNIAHNVLDRHATVDSTHREESAVIWEGEPGDVREVSFGDLHAQANRVANYLESTGVDVGDTVGLYMPMVPEVAAILYGCFKVGAIAVPIFSGFGVDATATRIDDSECTVLFTGDGFYRRGSEIELKGTADSAIEAAGHVEHVVVYDRLGSRDGGGGADIPWQGDRDAWWDDAIGTADDSYESASLPSNQESMLLYSSGTTGEPKGIVHTHAGGLLQPAKEIHFGFDQRPGDRFFWVSDIGWMMGPWTLIGNHAFGGTVFMYEGAPDHPEPDRLWEMIDRHDLTQFGISPTAIRALRGHGDDWVESHDLSSLRLLGSTGEPWDRESWEWFYEKVGGGERPIMNISGGTEIIGCFLMPTPIQPLKPCSLGGPGLGMDIDIIDAEGNSVAESNERGFLVARRSCPSMTKSLWSGDERYLAEYWSTWDDLWDHGDWAQQDEEGFWFLHGRADDALNVAGRKVGPAEIEGVLAEHEAVTQAAVVGVPDDTTGTAVIAFVIPDSEYEPTDALAERLRTLVGRQQGKPFRPREIYFVDDLPRTQSGKIIRRAVRAVAQRDEPGDLSSMENPAALRDLRERLAEDV
ncbi:AMP-binding protein [Halobellus captivus]|uniref:AMP-binding protein n=1 Tax=Halobellus captivus TaxID=2592614 RepID=UPI00119DEDD5|nr:AMP-binding protein [Halobellus captivus]